MHPYEEIPLNTAGYILGVWLILVHVWMLTKSDNAMAFLKRLPRNYPFGIAFMAAGMFWFWLLIIPERVFKSPLAMDLGEFNAAKTALFILVPIVTYIMIDRVREFLAVRGLGVIALMAAAPLLAAAWMEPAPGKLLIPIFSYGLLTAGLFWVGMPYLFRDAITWAIAKKSRFQALAFAGLTYGIAVLACALVWW
ncbi:hypothetical protein SAMN02745181_2887 [Rubritalea squalenifaciens DSM 18772]|uniref:Uncharacterized protein n=1 Tax=Rubritalea squalenifaciens DSM 18772 TaxID=1123071 RepID=A0A1M6NKL2_9BACT|nr:hypothetical protein [Rubritalea squalenifaciens]SHJ96308.1 hypothetical protein SAMN02745181_2887 [Rubritalea squalenifaciens DSM 18772]